MDAFSIAEFFCAAKPFQGSTNTLAPYLRAISRVRSVDPESSTIISPRPSLTKVRTLSRVQERFASSLCVMRTTEIVTDREYLDPKQIARRDNRPGRQGGRL